ncbi:MAG: flagellar FlbD family protein [Vulcanibacillus sp.]
MIVVNRLDGKEYVLNCLLIETLEKTPDTVVTLTNGKKYVVLQSVENIVEQFEIFIKRTHAIKY